MQEVIKYKTPKMDEDKPSAKFYEAHEDPEKPLSTAVFTPRSRGQLIKLKMKCDGIPITAIIDTGSQLNIAHKNVWLHALSRPMDITKKIVMGDANGGEGTLSGFIADVPLKCGNVVTYANLYVGSQAPFDLLLGRPWQRGNYISIDERVDGTYLQFKNKFLQVTHEMLVTPDRDIDPAISEYVARTAAALEKPQQNIYEAYRSIQMTAPHVAQTYATFLPHVLSTLPTLPTLPTAAITIPQEARIEEVSSEDTDGNLELTMDPRHLIMAPDATIRTSATAPHDGATAPHDDEAESDGPQDNGQETDQGDDGESTEALADEEEDEEEPEIPYDEEDDDDEPEPWQELRLILEDSHLPDDREPWEDWWNRARAYWEHRKDAPQSDAIRANSIERGVKHDEEEIERTYHRMTKDDPKWGANRPGRPGLKRENACADIGAMSGTTAPLPTPTDDDRAQVFSASVPDDGNAPDAYDALVKAIKRKPDETWNRLLTKKMRLDQVEDDPQRVLDILIAKLSEGSSRDRLPLARRLAEKKLAEKFERQLREVDRNQQKGAYRPGNVWRNADDDRRSYEREYEIGVTMLDWTTPEELLKDVKTYLWSWKSANARCRTESVEHSKKG